MSIAVMKLCWPLSMQPTAKAALMALADIARDDFKSWPSIDTLSRMTCFSKSSLIRAIEWLEKNHALVADRSNGRHTSYTLTPSEYVKPVSEWNRCQSGTGVTLNSEPVSLCTKPVSLCTKPVSERHSNGKELLEPPVKSNPQRERISGPNGFELFWSAYPNPGAKRQCLEKWLKRDLESIADRIVADVQGKKLYDRGWLDGYVPNAMTYINQERWTQAIKPVLETKHAQSKTLTGMQRLQELKNATVDDSRSVNGLPEAFCIELGSSTVR